MTGPATTVDLPKGDFSAHTPMMQQYLGVTFYSLSGEASETTLLALVPSWSPSRARQMQP